MNERERRRDVQKSRKKAVAHNTEIKSNVGRVQLGRGRPARRRKESEVSGNSFLEAGRNLRRTSRLKVARPTYDVRGLELRDDDGRDTVTIKMAKTRYGSSWIELPKLRNVREECERGDEGDGHAAIEGMETSASLRAEKGERAGAERMTEPYWLEVRVYP
jgi:hypothetical protein